jgi:adhesin HecA-like repeat protein
MRKSANLSSPTWDTWWVEGEPIFWLNISQCSTKPIWVYFFSSDWRQLMKAMTTKRRRTLALGIATLTLPLFLATGAAAEDRLNFREFRDLNPGMDKQSAREMFREARQNEGVRGAGLRMDSLNRPSPSASVGVASTVPMMHVRGRDRFLDAPRVRNQSLQAGDGGLVRLNNGVNLDLTSSERNIVLGRNLFSADDASVTIKVGSETKTFGAGTQVTAAEYVAVKQVLSGGNQSLNVSRNGAASGGSVDLSALTDGNTVMKASALTVASNVTAYGDFGKGSDFRLTGDLNNFGSVQTFSSTSRNEGAIRADDINNYSGASISSATNLTLDAQRNLTNDGVIVSQEGLTLKAGGEVRNSGVVSAAADVNVQASSTINRGVLQSVSGNINFNTDDASQMNVLNSRGTIIAENGAINIRNADYTGSGGSTIIGGDLISRDLNVNAGYGLAEINVGELTGVVNEYGNAAHVRSNTELLQLGNICLTGDPTFYNSLGGVSITSSINTPETLVIAASGSISVSGAANVGARNTNRGFDITLIAGADLEPLIDGADISTLPPVPMAGNEVIVTGKASKTGGTVVFGSNTTLTSRSMGGGGTENAGNISIYAFNGKDDGSGSVVFGSGSQILAGGRQGGQSGVIRIVAGGENDAVVLGGIVDVDAGVGGRLEIVTAQPVSSDKKLDIRYLADGTRDPNGARLVADTKLTKGATAHIAEFAGESIRIDATNIDVAASFNVGAGIVADEQIEFYALDKITHNANAAAIEVPLAIVVAGGNIGDRTASVRFGASLDSIASASNEAWLSVTAGANPLTVSGSAESLYVLQAPTRPVNALNLGYAPAYDFEVLKLNSLSFSSFTEIIDSFSLTTLSTDTVFAGFSNIKQVQINAVGAIGTLLNPMQTSNVESVQLRSSTGSVFYRKLDGKTAVNVDGSAHVGIEFANGLEVVNASSGAGDINVFGNGGTLSLTTLDALGQITVAHDGYKAKLTIASDANIITHANGPDAAPLTLSIGPASATVVSSVKGLEVFEIGTGDDKIRGNGLKAKKGAFLSVGNSDITLNNGLQSSAFSIGKNAGIITTP